MQEKKNIVIKVKYPSGGNASAISHYSSAGASKWDYRRIGLALGGLLLVIMSIFYFAGSGDKGDDDANKSAVVAEQETLPITGQEDTTTKAQQHEESAALSQPTTTKTSNNKVVVRSQLTHNIKNNEPVDSLRLPLKIGKSDNVWIYYFIELKGMDKQAVYHEWWLNGNLVSRKKVNVSDDPWRTASKQLITYTNNNDWIVKLVDDSRNTLVEKKFNLELKKD